jgi:hypothetical protein
MARTSAAPKSAARKAPAKKAAVKKATKTGAIAVAAPKLPVAKKSKPVPVAKTAAKNSRRR